MAMNQTCYALQSRSKCPFWLENCFANMVNDLLQAAHGSVFDTITTKTLERARVVISDDRLIDSFESAVAPLYRRILVNCEQSSTLAMIRDALLPKLISGELRVKDVDRFIAPAV